MLVLVSLATKQQIFQAACHSLRWAFQFQDVTNPSIKTQHVHKFWLLRRQMNHLSCFKQLWLMTHDSSWDVLLLLCTCWIPPLLNLSSLMDKNRLWPVFPIVSLMVHIFTEDVCPHTPNVKPLKQWGLISSISKTYEPPFFLNKAIC